MELEIIEVERVKRYVELLICIKPLFTEKNVCVYGLGDLVPSYPTPNLYNHLLNTYPEHFHLCDGSKIPEVLQVSLNREFYPDYITENPFVSEFIEHKKLNFFIKI
jgi:hypothetical protein